MIRCLVSIAALLTLAGCATGTDGAVPIGGGAYMIGGLGNMAEYSSSAVKARFFGQATEFCDKKGMDMQPLNSTGEDGAYGKYASAEVQFRCIPRANTVATPAKNHADDRWATTINTFIEMEAARPGGIDYREDKSKQNLLDRYVKSLANDPSNDGQSPSWYLIEANKKVRQDLGLGP